VKAARLPGWHSRHRQPLTRLHWHLSCAQALVSPPTHMARSSAGPAVFQAACRAALCGAADLLLLPLPPQQRVLQLLPNLCTPAPSQFHWSCPAASAQPAARAASAGLHHPPPYCQRCLGFGVLSLYLFRASVRDRNPESVTCEGQSSGLGTRWGLNRQVVGYLQGLAELLFVS